MMEQRKNKQTREMLQNYRVQGEGWGMRENYCSQITLLRNL